MADSTPSEPNAESQSQENSWSFQRVTVIAVLAFVGLYLGIFIIGLILALALGRSAATWLIYVQDLFTVALSISAIAIIIGIGVLLIQIARFVNLLRSEVKPITRDTRAAIKNVRTTTEFVQKRGVEPIIRVQSFLAGLIVFLRQIAHITRILQRPPESGDSKTDE